MSTETSASPPRAADAQAVASWRDDLDARVVALRGQAGGASTRADVLEALGALEVAQEELRVAEEEMVAQRAQIRALLEGQDTADKWRARLMAALPVPALLTTDSGVITEANAAAALVLHRRPVHLVGKPLAALVDQQDRRELRRVISALAGSGRESHLRLRVASPGLPVRPATVSVAAEDAGGRRLLRWILALDAAGPVARDADVQARTVAALAALTELPVSGATQQELLHRMAELARTAVPGADSVSITLGAPDEPQALSSDQQLAQRLDAQQMHAGQGPSKDAFDSREAVYAEDIATDERWPTLTSSLRASGDAVGAVLTVPVGGGASCPGVLMFCAEQPHGIAPDQIRHGELVGSAVSAVLQTVAEHGALADLAHNLETALESRAVIDQAKGMIMARYGCSGDEAFARLSALSQRQNVKLRELARLLVDGVSQGSGDTVLSDS